MCPLTEPTGVTDVIHVMTEMHARSQTDKRPEENGQGLRVQRERPRSLRAGRWTLTEHVSPSCSSSQIFVFLLPKQHLLSIEKNGKKQMVAGERGKLSSTYSCLHGLRLPTALAAWTHQTEGSGFLGQAGVQQPRWEEGPRWEEQPPRR